MSKVRVFIASSLDGFIAGPNDELDWLVGREGVEDTFTPFLQQIGALLMGRRTYDAISGFDGEWQYGQTPVVVATTRALDPTRPSVRGSSGTIEELIASARKLAGARDVYIDGGALIRSALDAGFVHDVTVTVVPIILGRGIPLFAGSKNRHPLKLLGCRPIGGGLVELRYGIEALSGSPSSHLGAAVSLG